MRNACIVLRNVRNSLCTLDFSPSEAFLSGGYPFEEVRLLSENDISALNEAVSQLKKSADNLAVIAEKSLS